MSQQEQKQILDAMQTARRELANHIGCYGDADAITALDGAIKILNKEI